MANKGKYYESQFEEATIALLREAHWQYTFGDDIHRKYTDPLIEEDLRNFLATQYKNKKLTVLSPIYAIQAGKMTITLFGMLFCYIVMVTTLHTAMGGIIHSAWNISTSSIPTIIFSVASISLSWSKVVRTVAPTFCFS